MAFTQEASPSEEPELFKVTATQNVGLNPKSGNGWQALYVYDEGSEKVTCVSCPPNGTPMTANVEVTPRLPVTGSIAILGTEFFVRYMSSDGRYVFFSSKDALVPRDANGRPDVYEYEVDTGQVKLISSGTDETGSWFEDASADGSDVFFLTPQQLTGWDTDKLIDLYDARVNGGFPEPPAPPVPCEGNACQGIPSAVPSFNTASGFTGLGNQAPARTVSVKKKAKPVKKPVKKKGRHRSKKHKKPKRQGKRSERPGRVTASRKAGR
jgi:hypothetical protein